MASWAELAGDTRILPERCGHACCKRGLDFLDDGQRIARCLAGYDRRSRCLATPYEVADFSSKVIAPLNVRITRSDGPLTEILGKGKVRFESGSATINPDSAGLLDRLAETALRCPTASVEIAGHTDNQGDDATNQALSEKRAQAVVDFFVRAGLPADRFKAVGYGSTQPVADNATEQGRAKNRRIDFLVR